MQISKIEFRGIHGLNALCVLATESMSVALHCQSKLPPSASIYQHRVSWLRDALRQQKRMPEFRNGAKKISFSPAALNHLHTA